MEKWLVRLVRAQSFLFSKTRSSIDYIEKQNGVLSFIFWIRYSVDHDAPLARPCRVPLCIRTHHGC